MQDLGWVDDILAGYDMWVDSISENGKTLVVRCEDSKLSGAELFVTILGEGSFERLSSLNGWRKFVVERDTISAAEDAEAAVAEGMNGSEIEHEEARLVRMASNMADELNARLGEERR